jgi:hypothetical protein
MFTFATRHFFFHLGYMGFATGNLPEPALCTSGLADTPHHTCRQGTPQPTHAHAPTPKQAGRATYTISAGVASKAAFQPQEGLRCTPWRKAIQEGLAGPTQTTEEGLWRGHIPSRTPGVVCSLIPPTLRTHTRQGTDQQMSWIGTAATPPYHCLVFFFSPLPCNPPHSSSSSRPSSQGDETPLTPVKGLRRCRLLCCCCSPAPRSQPLPRPPPMLAASGPGCQPDQTLLEEPQKLVLKAAARQPHTQDRGPYHPCCWQRRGQLPACRGGNVLLLHLISHLRHIKACRDNTKP